ncbi:DNA-directed RNA polymerase I subunit rpa49 [Massospora cicadina]|nr:DNA-directed RNA polymerase I subunit rpa49 [Massospora cicadina]
MEGAIKAKPSKVKHKRPRAEDNLIEQKGRDGAVGHHANIEVLDRLNPLGGPILREGQFFHVVKEANALQNFSLNKMIPIPGSSFHAASGNFGGCRFGRNFWDVALIVLVGAQFKGRLPATTTFIAFRHRKERRDKERAPEYVVKGQTELMAYQATSALPTSNGSQPEFKYMVGVYNKSRHQVSLVEAPFFEPQLRPTRLVDSDTHGRTTHCEYSDAKKNLDLAFGTRKKKSALSSMERNQVNYSLLSSASSTIQKLVSDAKVEEQENNANPTAGVEDLLPPHDSLTTLPDLIYPLAGMINPEILKSIQVKGLSKCSGRLEPKEFLAFGRSPFINSEIASGQSSQNHSRIRLLVYLDWLLALLNERKGEVYASPSTLGKRLLGAGKNAIVLSPVMTRHICETFLEKGHGQAPGRQSLGTIYKLTARAKLKLQIHVILLLLHLNNFKLEVDIPAKAMSLDTSRVRTLMKGIGCKFTRPSKEEKSTSGSIGVLTAPLVIPEIRKAKGKRQ